MSKSVWDMTADEARDWSARNAAPAHMRQRNAEREMDEVRQRSVRQARDEGR